MWIRWTYCARPLVDRRETHTDRSYSAALLLLCPKYKKPKFSEWKLNHVCLHPDRIMCLRLWIWNDSFLITLNWPWTYFRLYLLSIILLLNFAHWQLSLQGQLVLSLGQDTRTEKREIRRSSRSAQVSVDMAAGLWFGPRREKRSRRPILCAHAYACGAYNRMRCAATYR